MKYAVIAALLAVARAEPEDGHDHHVNTWENGPRWMMSVSTDKANTIQVMAHVPMGQYMQIEFPVKDNKRDVVVFQGRGDCDTKDGYADVNEDGTLGRINDDGNNNWRDLDRNKNRDENDVEICNFTWYRDFNTNDRDDWAIECTEEASEFQVNIVGNASKDDPNHDQMDSNWSGVANMMVGPNCESIMAGAVKAAAAFTASVLVVSSLYM